MVFLISLILTALLIASGRNFLKKHAAVCYVLAYGIATPVVMYILSGAGQKIQENAAMLAGMCLFTGFNYIGQRMFAFKE